MKSYTDIEQSKKLAEILPHESADMWYWEWPTAPQYNNYERPMPHKGEDIVNVPCWSLASLLGVLPEDCGINKEDGKYVASYITSDECGAYTKDNPLDACYEMILKLHELKLL